MSTPHTPHTPHAQPVVPDSAWVHASAVVLGAVTLGDDVSVWPLAVIRGDTERIVVGDRSNVQDGAIVHADPGFPAVVGADCVIGHRAIVHGAELEDGVLVGMGAIVMNGARVGTGAVIGAGAVVTEGMQIAPGSLVLGVPAKVVRALDASQQAAVRENAARYVALKERHRAGEIGVHAS